jgi:hypothetical protein
MSIEEVLARIARGDRSWRRDTTILALLDAKTQIWLREIRASPYFRGADEALSEICNHGNTQLGALQYFRTACPQRARLLETDLWQRIEKLWDEGAPLEEFQAVLDQWVQLHREAFDLFAKAIEIGDEAALAAKTAWNKYGHLLDQT